MQNEAHQNEMLEFGTGKGFFQIHTRIWVALALRTQSTERFQLSTFKINVREICGKLLQNSCCHILCT